MSNDTLVRYTHNSDPSVSTGSLKFEGDNDRPPLLIGEVGYVSEAELHQAIALGAILEPITENEVRELGLQMPETVEVTETPAPRPTTASAPAASSSAPSLSTPGGSAS